MKLFDKIKEIHDNKVDGTGLALFRITYSIVLFFEIAQLYYYRHLVFDRIPYLVPYEIDFTFPLLIWLGVILMMVFGLYTRIASILNWVLTIVFLATISTYEYHMFYVYQGVNFLLMFLPVSKMLSFDRKLLTMKHSTTKSKYVPPTKVSQWAYYIPVLVALAFVYFDSIFFKFSSPNWMSGMGLWFPASLPMITHVDTSFLMNQKWLVYTLGYVTICFELVFMFIFWFKWARWPLFIVGAGLHLGILLEFPIPYFALGVCAIYLLMVPVSFWGTVGRWLKITPAIPTDQTVKSAKTTKVKNTGTGKKRPEKVTTNTAVPIVASENRKTILFPKYTVREAKVAVYTFGVALLILAQIFVTIGSFYMAFKTGADRQKSSLYGAFNKVHSYSKPLLGVTNHPVFMDYHFGGFNHIVAITYNQNGKEIFLPVTDEQGTPGPYLTGFTWVKWTFRANAPFVNQNTLSQGVRDFTAFWAYKNGVNLNNTRFNIKVKIVESPGTWQHDFYKKQIAHPWIDGGYVQWENRNMKSFIKNIEQIGTRQN